MAFSGIMMNGSWEIMDGLYSLGSVTTELHDGTNNDKTALLFLQEWSPFFSHYDFPIAPNSCDVIVM